MTIPQPQYQKPQHQQPQYEDPCPALDNPSTPAPQLLVPPPQFGRLPHNTSPEESAPSRFPQVDSSSRSAQPEPLAGFGARAIIFLIDYVTPAIGLIILLCLGVRTGSTVWRLVLAVVGVGLLGCGIWNWRLSPRGATARSLGCRVLRMTEDRRLVR